MSGSVFHTGAGQLTGNPITEKTTSALVMTQESCILRDPCRPWSLLQDSGLVREFVLALEAVYCVHNLGKEACQFLLPIFVGFAYFLALISSSFHKKMFLFR